MDVEDLDLLLQLAEEGAVNVEWEQGDLVLLDVSYMGNPSTQMANEIRTTLFSILVDLGRESGRYWPPCGTTTVELGTILKGLSYWRAALAFLLQSQKNRVVTSTIGQSEIQSHKVMTTSPI